MINFFIEIFDYFKVIFYFLIEIKNIFQNINFLREIIFFTYFNSFPSNDLTQNRKKNFLNLSKIFKIL